MPQGHCLRNVSRAAVEDDMPEMSQGLPLSQGRCLRNVSRAAVVSRTLSEEYSRAKDFEECLKGK